MVGHLGGNGALGRQMRRLHEATPVFKKSAFKLPFKFNKGALSGRTSGIAQAASSHAAGHWPASVISQQGWSVSKMPNGPMNQKRHGWSGRGRNQGRTERVEREERCNQCKPATLRIMYWNAGGLSPAKKVEMCKALADYQVDILLLQEAHLKDSIVKLSGFEAAVVRRRTTERTDKEKIRGVDVAIFAHSTSQWTRS